MTKRNTRTEQQVQNSKRYGKKATPAKARVAQIKDEAKKVKAALRKAKEAQVEADEDEAENEEKVSRSIVKPVYRARYAPTDDRCGDELSRQISEAICSPDAKGRMRVDLEKLRRLGEANGAWVDSYANLNPGQQRMTLGNKLRAKVRRGNDIVWTA